MNLLPDYTSTIYAALVVCKVEDAGSTVVVIEHNMDGSNLATISSTWGPRIREVPGAQGTPEQVAEYKNPIPVRFGNSINVRTHKLL